jgi:hypothetical protein
MESLQEPHHHLQFRYWTGRHHNPIEHKPLVQQKMSPMTGEEMPNGDVSELLMVRFSRSRLRIHWTTLPHMAGRCLIHQSVPKLPAGGGVGGCASS